MPYFSHTTGHGRITLIQSLLALQTDGLGALDLPANRGTDGKQSCQFPLPAGMIGSWNLVLQVTPQKNKLSGTATLTLSNNRTLNYTVRGSYSARHEISTLRLVGCAETTGSSLLIKAQGPEMQLNGRQDVRARRA
jgi:hypothetical protein